MKIIIIGCGKIGKTIATALAGESHDIVLIDQNEKLIEELTNTIDVLGIVGNATSYSILKEAGVEKADVLIAVTESDEVNMLSCLFARKASNCATIARVRNPIYIDEINYIREELGISMIINPEMQAAKEIALLLSFPEATKIDTFSKGRLNMLTFEVPEGSVLCGAPIMEVMPKLNCQVLIGGIERDERVIIPNGRTEIKPHDIISIVASPKEVIKFFQNIGMSSKKVKNCMIVGGSRIAHYLAKDLSRSMNVTIIEQNHRKCEELSKDLPNVSVICGDGTSEDVLREEGLLRTNSFVSLTNIDEENIMLGMYVQSVTNAKVITKINRIQFDSMIHQIKAGSTIYPKHLAADHIIQYVRALGNAEGNNIESLYKILDGNADAMSFKIKDKCSLVGKPLEELKLKENLLVLCIVRHNQLITPSGKTTIQVGDSVIVVTTNAGLQDVEDILK